MDINFFTKGLTAEEERKLQEYAQKKLSSFTRLLSHFDIDAVRLDINCERFIKNNAFCVDIILRLPSKIIVGKEASHTLQKAVDLAKDRAVKQLKKHEKQWRRYDKDAQRMILEFERTHFDSQFMKKEEKKEEPFEGIRPMLGRLRQFVTREVSHYKDIGQLPPEKDKTGILDEVIAEYYENFQLNKKNTDMEEWLYSVAIQKIQEAVRDYQNQQRTHVSLQRKEGIDTRMSSYFQPDETDQLEEIVLKDDIKTPEKLVERRELLKFLSDSLHTIPEFQRQTFVLFTIERFPMDMIAKIQKRSGQEVKNDIEQVKNVLVQKIQDEYGVEITSE